MTCVKYGENIEKYWKPLHLETQARRKTGASLGLKSELSLTHSVLNMFSNQWRTVSSGHVMHTQSQWRAVMYASCCILNLSFNLFVRVFGTAKVFNNCPYLLVSSVSLLLL